MVSTFDVPGSVTLRSVIRPPSGETTAQRLHRLASKGVIEGCRVLRVYRTGAFLVTSARDERTAYTVDSAVRTCDCPGFARHAICKHVALVLAELGELPDPEPEPTAPAAVIVPAFVEVVIVCACCAGSGTDAAKDARGNWHDITCHLCSGRGRHTITLPAADVATFEHMSADELAGEPCAVCFGRGFVPMMTGAHLTDWTPLTCRDCQGAGLVPVAIPTADTLAA